MVRGWMELFRTKFQRQHDFVSADARRLSNDPRTYEMLGGTGPQLNIQPPDRVATSPNPRSVSSPEPDLKQDRFGPARVRVSPDACRELGKGFDMKISTG